MKVNVLSEHELLKWSRKYDDEQSLSDKNIETHIGNRLRSTKELSKTDLFEVIKWKFEGFKGRQMKVTRHAELTDDLVLRKVSEVVLDLDKKYDEYKIDLLCVFDGIGAAVASTILTFHDPENYGVFDIHVWRELFGEQPKNLHTTKNYLHLVNELRKIGAKYKLSVRTVEKAYYKKNYDK